MNKIVKLPNTYNKHYDCKFGIADGLLRVLAKKNPNADLSNSAITFQMSVIAKKLQQADLLDLEKDEPANLEDLIELMQIAEYLIELVNNKSIIKRTLRLVEKIQEANIQNLDLIDIMILIANRENKDVVNAFNAMSLKDVQAL